MIVAGGGTSGRGPAEHGSEMVQTKRPGDPVHGHIGERSSAQSLHVNGDARFRCRGVFSIGPCTYAPAVWGFSSDLRFVNDCTQPCPSRSVPFFYHSQSSPVFGCYVFRFFFNQTVFVSCPTIASRGRQNELQQRRRVYRNTTRACFSPRWLTHYKVVGRIHIRVCGMRAVAIFVPLAFRKSGV